MWLRTIHGLKSQKGGFQMASHTRILSIAGVLALGALTAFAAPQGAAKSSSASEKTKTSAPKVSTHVVEGSVVAVSNDSLTVRSGKKDMTFKLNSTTQKPASLAAGSQVSVNYHDEANQHLATSIEPAAAKANKASTKK
jgi:hypothetical protein